MFNSYCLIPNLIAQNNRKESENTIIHLLFILSRNYLLYQQFNNINSYFGQKDKYNK